MLGRCDGALGDQGFRNQCAGDQGGRFDFEKRPGRAFHCRELTARMDEFDVLHARGSCRGGTAGLPAVVLDRHGEKRELVDARAQVDGRRRKAGQQRRDDLGAEIA